MSPNVSLPEQSVPPYTIETWPVGKLKKYERNARLHSPKQVEQLRDSFRKFGQVWPILVREDATIIAGHGRLEAARAEGLTEVRVIVAAGWTEEQCRAFGVLDNKVALNSTWDEALLASELADLGGMGVELGMLGFDPTELAALSGNGGQEGLTDPDDAPEPPVNPVATLGDLWALGRHRLLCGDSTKDIDRLIENQTVDCVVTDPPYGMRLDTDFSGIKGSLKSMGRKHGTKGKKYDHVIGDHEDFDPGPIIERLTSVVEQFWFGADYYAERIPQRGHGSWLVWDKRKESQADAIGSEFELCWSRQKHKRRMLRHDWFGFLSSENGSDARNRVHPTQKPVTLLVDIMEQWTNPKGVVFDPFVGSGSTIIASESSGRSCFAIELDPAYVDVCIKRWQDFTGQKATLEGDGRTFEEVAAERLPKAA